MKVTGFRGSSGRLADRKVDELVGICRGMLADGELNASEATFLQDWLRRSGAYVDQYPFNALYARLSTALLDGVLDHDEESDLLGTLAQFVGGEAFHGREGVASLSTALPFCSPEPEIRYEPAMTYFCITGTFNFGSRTDVMREIMQRDVYIDDSVLKRTNYLVVGEFASRDWMHSNYGRKIEKAVEFRDAGQRIAIVSEAHWVASLQAS